MCIISSPSIPLSDFNIYKIHVLYIVNLVSKTACHDIVKGKRKVHANFVQRNVCLIFFPYALAST